MFFPLYSPSFFNYFFFLSFLLFRLPRFLLFSGYGSYTPNTNAGKIFVILYGFLGCAGGILFFNLFLERMITFFAFILREIYVRKLQSRDQSPDLNVEQLIADWKPSIYSVMLCLFICVVSIGSIAVPTYSMLEGWSYVEAAYFCFVSFATIGFGDFVAAQNNRHNNFYVLANIVILAIGCCFLYSVFNVISIVLKQILNWLIYRLQALSTYWHHISRRRHNDRMLRKYSLKMQKERRHCHRRKSSVHSVRRTLRRKDGAGADDASGAAELNDAARKMSDDGLISMKDFFTSNQVSLALMQKQLQDSAREQNDPWHSPPSAQSPHISRHAAPAVPIVPPVSRHAAPAVPTVSSTVAPTHKSSFPAGRFIPGTIGPLAILCDKLGDR